MAPVRNVPFYRPLIDFRASIHHGAQPASNPAMSFKEIYRPKWFPRLISAADTFSRCARRREMIIYFSEGVRHASAEIKACL